jgi:3-dehydroquinate synthetase
VILDAELFSYLESNAAALLAREQSVLAHVVARCCRLKADVVENDEHEETGLRAILNFGHTFGHAFETLSGYGNILHGDAVAIGMLCAARLAERLGRVDAAFTARLHALLVAFGLPVAVPSFDPEQIFDSMMHDKKVQYGQLSLVLPSCLGHVELVRDIAKQDILAALENK